jgi:hypothetical protein
MRGQHEQQGGVFSYVSPEQRIPHDHPIRQLRHRGLERVGWMFAFAAAAYNLVAIRNMSAVPHSHRLHNCPKAPLTCTETSSGLHREFWSDLIASSAVNLPITRASLRLGVIWMGVESIRCTYSVARVLPRFTFTTNFVHLMVSHRLHYTRMICIIAPLYKPSDVARN